MSRRPRPPEPSSLAGPLSPLPSCMCWFYCGFVAGSGLHAGVHNGTARAVDFLVQFSCFSVGLRVVPAADGPRVCVRLLAPGAHGAGSTGAPIRGAAVQAGRLVRGFRCALALTPPFMPLSQLLHGTLFGNRTCTLSPPRPAQWRPTPLGSPRSVAWKRWTSRFRSLPTRTARCAPRYPPVLSFFVLSVTGSFLGVPSCRAWGA